MFEFLDHDTGFPVWVRPFDIELIVKGPDFFTLWFDLEKKILINVTDPFNNLRYLLAD